MDKSVMEALQFDHILACIEPAGETGKHYKRHLTPWKPGQENDLRKEYKRLELLLAALSKDKRLAPQLGNALSVLPYLPHTLKALQERPLQLHECFEIKKLVHYARMLRKYCLHAGLDKLYVWPDLDNLYALLNPDHLNSPAFTLSPAFDTMMAKHISRLQDLQLKQRELEHHLQQAAREALKLSKPSPSIVLSRQLTKEAQKLQKSGFYYLAEENFANLTFKLKETPELAAIHKQIALLTAKLEKTEAEVLVKLSKKVKTFTTLISKTVEVVKLLDWDVAKAAFAQTYNCCLPTIVTKTQVSLRQAINLPLRESLMTNNRTYQAPDLRFASALNVLTGPNMGGKTSALQTVGQICLLTAYALPVPAREAELCLFDRVWYNKEAMGGENLSSFGHEIVSLTEILSQPGKTLYLLDELAKGTNPAEGEAILLAVLQYLAEQSCLVLAATHYDQPARMEKAAQYTIKGIDPKALESFAKADKATLNSQLDLLNSLMDYNPVRLSIKTKPPQNAIPIARILGLPEAIITLAQKFTGL